MAIRDFFKVTRKTFIDPRSWLGYDVLKSQNVSLLKSLKTLATPTEATRAESFEAAVERLKLSEEDLKSAAQNAGFFATLFTVLGAGMIGVGLYLLFQYGSFAGLVLAISMTALFFGQAFQYSFWRFQIQKRKLGCTFHEWLHRQSADK